MAKNSATISSPSERKIGGMALQNEACRLKLVMMFGWLFMAWLWSMVQVSVVRVQESVCGCAAKVGPTIRLEESAAWLKGSGVLQNEPAVRQTFPAAPLRKRESTKKPSRRTAENFRIAKTARLVPPALLSRRAVKP